MRTWTWSWRILTSALVLINLKPDATMWGTAATAEASAYRLDSQSTTGFLNASLLLFVPVGMIFLFIRYRQRKRG